MEALIVALFALTAITLVEIVYSVAISLWRWAPVITFGVFVGWLTERHGAEPLEALGYAILACVVARHMFRPRRRQTSSQSSSTRSVCRSLIR